MNAAQPTSTPAVPMGMLRSITDAICDRPADSAEQRAARRSVVTEMARGFQPRSAVETMLVGMVIAHAHLLEDAMHDVFHGRDERVKAQTKSSIVGLDRGMFGFLRELRMVQDRRVKAEAAAGVAAGAVVVGGTVAQNPPHRTPAPETKPVIRKATTDPLARATVLEPPNLASSPLRRTQASGIAMNAMLSPTMVPVVSSAALRKRETSLSPDIGGRLISKATADNVDARAAQ